MSEKILWFFVIAFMAVPLILAWALLIRLLIKMIRDDWS
jgi:hypothetical protein